MCVCVCDVCGSAERRVSTAHQKERMFEEQWHVLFERLQLKHGKKKKHIQIWGAPRQSLMPTHGFVIRIGALGSKIQILEDVSREAWNIKW